LFGPPKSNYFFLGSTALTTTFKKSSLWLGFSDFGGFALFSFLTYSQN
jgi:hypothetical protein